MTVSEGDFVGDEDGAGPHKDALRKMACAHKEKIRPEGRSVSPPRRGR